MKMSDVLGGDSFTLPCRLAANGLAMNVTALIDTGANGEVFIHTKHFDFVEKRLRVYIRTARKPVSLTGYDNKHSESISRVFTANLVIEGRRVETHFIFCDTGRHDLFVGRRWLAKTKALADCANRRLVWLEEPPYQASKDLVVPRKHARSLEVDPTHQSDADRRDELFKVNEPVRILKRSDGPEPLREVKDNPRKSVLQLRAQPTTWRMQQKEDIRKMSEQLRPTPTNEQVPVGEKKARKPQRAPTYTGVDIALLEAPGFLRGAKQKGVVLRTTSIGEIDHLIKEQQGKDLVPEDPEEVRQMIKNRLPSQYWDFADVFSKVASDKLPLHKEKVDHDIVLEADNNLLPSPLYSMSLEQLELVKEYLKDHLYKGFIVPSDAPYASPVLFAKKPGGGWRFCVDYRKLNAITKKDRYPLPLIEETLARLAKAKVFTKLDIRQAFYRIRMKKGVEDLTTFRTRYGSYKYKVLPFGLCNGPASFQRYINDVLFDYLDDICTAYVDDILIYSDDPLEHEAHVKKVLQRLKDAGLQADIKKSEFSVTSTKFLGYIISTDGINMDPEKVAVVKDWPVPKSVKEVQSFLGFCNFYRVSLKQWGRVIRPITKLTCKGAWHSFGEVEVQAFERAKELVLSAEIRAHYSPHLPIRTETDASDGVVAGVLTQL